MGKKIKTRFLEEVDLAAVEWVLDWKTLHQKQPGVELSSEPIAGESGGAASSSSSAPKAAPTQAQLQHSFDQRRTVGEEVALTKRQKRARRAQLLDSGHRVFTEDVCQADSFLCQ